MKKIKFDGFTKEDGKLNTEASYILKLLEKHYDVELSDEPDYIFYNVNGHEYYKYDCIRIFCTIEAVCPDFNLCDYGIGFENLVYEDRYFRYPNFYYYPEIVNKMVKKHFNVTNDLTDRKFCSYVYSNAEAAPMRVELYKKISEYKSIDAGGKLFNNQPNNKRIENKQLFESEHKFSIACENACHPGYHTEKLAEAFANRTVPIYWGDPKVGELFNEKAFVNCQAFESIDEVVEYIKYLDSNEEAYLSMLSEPVFRERNLEKMSTGIMEEFEKYLLHIFEQPLEQAYRRNKGFWGMYYLQSVRSKERLIEKYQKIRNNIIVNWFVEQRVEKEKKKKWDELVKCLDSDS